MDRRKFVQSTLLSGALINTGFPVPDTAAMENEKNKRQQWYELRTWLFANDAQRQLTSDYLEQAYLPALSRAGVKNIGVFYEMQPAATAKIILLLPFDSIASLPAIDDRLSQDAVYQKAGEAYLSARPSSPAYERMESSLLKAFLHMPLIEVPEKKERLFELRCYESPTESAGQKKIEMFNKAGEIDIFKKIGARPVFFGETIIGERRPNLIYLLCFDNMEAHDSHWKAFGSDPEWKKVSAIPEYSDANLISKITRTFLVPTPYSQV